MKYRVTPNAGQFDYEDRSRPASDYETVEAAATAIAAQIVAWMREQEAEPGCLDCLYIYASGYGSTPAQPGLARMVNVPRGRGKCRLERIKEGE